MKYIVIASTLLFSCFCSQLKASDSVNEPQLSAQNIVSERLAAKSLNEIVVLAMKLQLECQQLNSSDVCNGVKTILAVVDERLAMIPSAKEDTSTAFLKGLLEGVSQANQTILVQLDEAER